MQAILCWSGGKRAMVKEILRRMPPHLTYVEPFFGAGWVFWQKQKAEKEIINDIDKALIRFYRSIQDARKFNCDMSPDEKRFFRILEKHKAGQELPMCDYLFMNKYSFRCNNRTYAPSEAIKCNEQAEPRTCQVKALVKDFGAYTDRLAGVKIENRDWRQVCTEADGKDTLFFLDPPYWKTACDYVSCNVVPAEMAKFVKGLRGRWIVTLNEHPDVRSAFRGSNIEVVNAVYNKGNYTGAHHVPNLVIRNYSGYFDKS